MEATIVITEDELWDMIHTLNEAREQGKQSGMFEIDGIGFHLIPTEDEKLKKMRSILGEKVKR